MIVDLEVKAPGLGQSQQSILAALKRRGEATIRQLAEALELNVETIRSHMRTLVGHGLVRREGRRRSGPGRPEIVYVLTSVAEALFPRREGAVFQELAEFLRETGQERVIQDFFDRFIGGRRVEAMGRVEGLEGRDRLEEVACILSDLGFMAVIEEMPDGPKLRLCHCPLRELVRATKVPCRAEIGFISELLGERLTRVSYIPAGDASCSYMGAIKEK